MVVSYTDDTILPTQGLIKNSTSFDDNLHRSNFESNNTSSIENTSNNSHLFDNEFQSDVLFIVGYDSDPCKWRFPGHKNILACNPHLKKLLENAQAPDNAVYVNNVNKRGFELLLKCLYTKKIELQSFVTALEGLVTAQQYDCLPLATICVEYIDSHLDPTAVLTVLTHIGFKNPHPPLVSTSINTLINQLRHNCFIIVDKHANQVLESETMEDLRREDVQVILKRDSLRLPDEIHVWVALDKWLDRECKRMKVPTTNSSKRVVLGDMSDLVRYSLMKRKDFMAGPGKVLTSHEWDFKQSSARKGSIGKSFPLSKRSGAGNRRNSFSGVIENKCLDCICRTIVCLFD